MTRSSLIRPLYFLAASYTLAGGYVHLREWLDVYRHVPATIPGAWVVRVGFPLTAAISVALTASLALAATRRGKFAVAILAANVAFQFGSLGVLIATRVGSVFHWTEPVWSDAAKQIRAAEIGTLTMLALTVVFIAVSGKPAAMAPAPGR